MKRLFSVVFLVTLSALSWSQQAIYQGRIDLVRDLASFEKLPPVPGTLYLLSGAAGDIRIVSTEPFVAEVDFVEGEWKDEATLIAHHVLLRFEGAGWSKIVVVRKPKEGADRLVYPYRKFQAAVLPDGKAFKVVAIPVFF